MSDENFLVQAIGYPATLLHGDSTVLDRWHFLKRHLLPGPLRTFDAGSGSGAMSMYAAKRGNRVLGMSLSPRDNAVATERAKMLGISGVEFVTGDLRQLDELSRGWEPFDQIICFETVEHIINDQKLLHDLSRVLKPGGRLLLTTPYVNYNHMPGDELSTHEDGGHVRWGYTHDEMRTMMRAAGLEVAFAEYVTGYFSQVMMRFHRWLMRHGVSPRAAWVLSFPTRLLQPLDLIAMKMSKYPALSIAVVAVKVGS